jgi:hypothetical protein
MSCLNAEQTARLRELSQRYGRDSNRLNDDELVEIAGLIGLISAGEQATDDELR